MVDAPTFKLALGRFLSGVTVVSAEHDGIRRGMTVSAFSSVSLTPPLILVCLDRRAATLPLVREAGRFGVSILAAGQERLSNHFAGWGDATVAWTTLGGSPVLAGSIATLDCAVHRVLDGGDHEIVLGLVEAAETGDGAPLAWWSGKYRNVGSEA
jgi:flavin reductase (DIM6/NTAB) family NADH-FMN oxidoreductase RutF